MRRSPMRPRGDGGGSPRSAQASPVTELCLPSTSPSTGSPVRVVHAEELDSLPPDDPRARRSRVDLQRVHRAMRTLSILAQGIARLGLPVPPRRILELGAGDGTLLARLLRALRAKWGGGE